MKELRIGSVLLLGIMILGAPLWALADTWGAPIGKVAKRFVVLDSDDGEAVLDKETGLVWERSPGTSTVDSWYAAQRYCTNLTLGNRLGWRLPRVQELASLADPTVPPPGPILPVGHPFSDVQSSNFYWSGTGDSSHPDLDAWVVCFRGDGDCGIVIDSADLFAKSGFGKNNAGYFVWCVRGGAGGALQ